MGLWNLGSVAAETLILLSDIPDNISGALPRIADRQREKVQNYTGTTIGSNSIGIKHQEAILQLTIAKTAKDMMSIGVDASQVKLGDFTVSKGSNSNLDTIYKNSTESAEEELKHLGRTSTTFKANG